MLTDVFALGLSMIAIAYRKETIGPQGNLWLSENRPSGSSHQCVSLMVIALFIFYESYHRFLSPPQIHTSTMLIIADLD